MEFPLGSIWGVIAPLSCSFLLKNIRFCSFRPERDDSLKFQKASAACRDEAWIYFQNHGWKCSQLEWSINVGEMWLHFLNTAWFPSANLIQPICVSFLPSYFQPPLSNVIHSSQLCTLLDLSFARKHVTVHYIWNTRRITTKRLIIVIIIINFIINNKNYYYY